MDKIDTHHLRRFEDDLTQRMGFRCFLEWRGSPATYRVRPVGASARMAQDFANWLAGATLWAATPELAAETFLSGWTSWVISNKYKTKQGMKPEFARAPENLKNSTRAESELAVCLGFRCGIYRMDMTDRFEDCEYEGLVDLWYQVKPLGWQPGQVDGDMVHRFDSWNRGENQQWFRSPQEAAETYKMFFRAWQTAGYPPAQY